MKEGDDNEPQEPVVSNGIITNGYPRTLHFRFRL